MTDEVKRCMEALRACDLHKNIQPVAFFVCSDCPGYKPDTTCRVNLTAADLIESLSAELEQVKAERYAAVKDLKEFSYYPCLTCKHRTGVHYCEKFGERTPGRDMNDVIFCGQYEWRGVQEHGIGADNETR